MSQLLRHQAVERLEFSNARETPNHPQYLTENSIYFEYVPRNWNHLVDMRNSDNVSPINIFKKLWLDKKY